MTVQRAMIVLCCLLGSAAAAAEQIVFDGPRPVFEGVRFLRASRFALVSYEDARIEYEDDMKGAVDANNHHSDGHAINRGGKLIFSYSSENAGPDLAGAIDSIIKDGSDPGLRFKVIKYGSASSDVAVSEIRSTSGQWRTYKLDLDARIVVSDQERDGFEFLKELCKQTSRANGDLLIFNDDYSMRGLIRTHVKGEQAGVARDILAAFIANTDRQIVWSVLCAPRQPCVLNLSRIDIPQMPEVKVAPQPVKESRKLRLKDGTGVLVVKHVPSSE